MSVAFGFSSTLSVLFSIAVEDPPFFSCHSKRSRGTPFLSCHSERSPRNPISRNVQLIRKVRSESCLQVQTCRSTSCQRGQPRPIGFLVLVVFVKFCIFSSNNVAPKLILHQKTFLNHNYLKNYVCPHYLYSQ